MRGVAVLPEVRAAVDALPDGERDALVLAAWEGLSYDDIAVGAVDTGRHGSLTAQPRPRKIRANSRPSAANSLHTPTFSLARRSDS